MKEKLWETLYQKCETLYTGSELEKIESSYHYADKVHEGKFRKNKE